MSYLLRYEVGKCNDIAIGQYNKMFMVCRNYISDGTRRTFWVPLKRANFTCWLPFRHILFSYKRTSFYTIYAWNHSFYLFIFNFLGFFFKIGKMCFPFSFWNYAIYWQWEHCGYINQGHTNYVQVLVVYIYILSFFSFDHCNYIFK